MPPVVPVAIDDAVHTVPLPVLPGDTLKDREVILALPHELRGRVASPILRHTRDGWLTSFLRGAPDAKPTRGRGALRDSAPHSVHRGALPFLLTAFGFVRLWVRLPAYASAIRVVLELPETFGV